MNQPLDTIDNKEWWKIVAIEIKDSKLLNKLTSFGIVIGNNIKLDQKSIFTDPSIFKVGQTQEYSLISLRKNEIAGISVSPAQYLKL